MVQTRSGQASTASESKPQITHFKATKAKKDVKGPIEEQKTELPTEIVPEKRKRDDEVVKDVAQDQDRESSSKAEQPPPNKAVKENEETTETSAGQDENSEKFPAAIAHKIHKTIEEYGTLPLEGLGVDKPLESTPEILLAIVIDSMLKSTRISHLLAQKASISVFKAGYHDINVLSNTSWDDRVQVLSEGGYNRYRETTATKLGDLAQLVNEKYGSFHQTQKWR